MTHFEDTRDQRRLEESWRRDELLEEDQEQRRYAPPPRPWTGPPAGPRPCTNDFEGRACGSREVSRLGYCGRCGAHRPEHDQEVSR